MTDRRNRNTLRDQIARASHRKTHAFTNDAGDYAILCECGHVSVGRKTPSTNAKARAAQLHRHHARAEAERSPLYRDQGTLPL